MGAVSDVPNTSAALLSTINTISPLESAINMLKSKQSEHGDEHLDVTSACDDLGKAYKEVKEYTKAIEAFNQALHIRRKLLATRMQMWRSHWIISARFMK